jgi:hypothetical protein
MQKENENTFSQSITNGFLKNPKKVYILCGKFKEGGLRILEESLYDLKAKIFFAIGIDKKNTTKNMLEELLKYTDDVYIYSNNNVVEFDSTIFIFEYTDNVVIYSSASSFSESGICDNLSLYTETIYNILDNDEKKEYKKQLKDIKNNIEKDIFKKLKQEDIEELIKQKEIFTTNQYTHHNIKSISELLNKNKVKEKLEEKEDEYTKNNRSSYDQDEENIDISIDLSDITEELENPNVLLNNLKKEEELEVKNGKVKENEDKLQIVNEKEDIVTDFKDMINTYEIDDIDTEELDLEVEEIKNKTQNEAYCLDIEDMLFSKSDIKLDLTDTKNEEKKESENKKKSNDYKLNNDNLNFLEDENVLVQVKKVDLNNISNLIFELPSKSIKKQDLDCIKIPNYIQNMIPEFFELSEKGKNEEINGSIYKSRDIDIELVDVKLGKKYSDRNAKITHKLNQTYINLVTSTINNIQYEEKDIIRIIKLASDLYHIEIIQKDMQEYKLWSKICTQDFKSSKRKYGMM